MPRRHGGDVLERGSQHSRFRPRTRQPCVLALLDAVFTAFAIAQILVTGAAQETLKSAGVSYSEYARSGFFQLLWAGGITLVTLATQVRPSR
jgi:Domain of unknown function (DUF4173)